MNNAISIRCNRANLIHIRAFVKTTLNSYSLVPIVLNQMILAVDEICANLIIHGNAEDENKFLRLTITRENDLFVFKTVDHGKFFQVSSYTQPIISNHVKHQRKGGLGLALVYRIMDKVEYTSHNNENVCRLYKKEGLFIYECKGREDDGSDGLFITLFHTSEKEPVQVHGKSKDKETKAEIIFDNGKFKEVKVKKVKGKEPLEVEDLIKFKKLVAHYRGDIVRKREDFFVDNKEVKSETVNLQID